jgi:hypothetical protein
MCLALDTILTDQQTYDARDRFETLFKCLLDTRKLTPKTPGKPDSGCRHLASELNGLANYQKDALRSLPETSTYSRNIIGVDDTWIGFICRWQANILSSIHGHPSFAYYQVLDGHMLMEVYEPVNHRHARCVSTRDMHRGESVLSTKQAERYDNFIHRVKTYDIPVYTLHLYSDNPAKGKVFEAV